jgi:UDP-sulfoquinovose synthase
MRDPEHANLTIQKNTAITSNVLNAIVKADPSIHLVHLGTMGVYGYGTFGEETIPEGYIDVTFNDRKASIVHPYNPGSIYHMTKCLDNQMFHTYSKLYRLKITDLHQGIVWGFETEETRLHVDLINRVDYDSEYGTVLNRLLVQAAHQRPLTVYGKGGQTRAFIHLSNSVDCICLAVENDQFDASRVRILNQMTECHCLSTLTDLLSKQYGVRVSNLDNPRQEAESNPLSVCNRQFLELGLEPIHLGPEAVEEMVNFILEQPGNVNWEIVEPMTYWPMVRNRRSTEAKENAKLSI